MSNITIFGWRPLPWIDIILLGWFTLTTLSVNRSANNQAPQRT